MKIETKSNAIENVLFYDVVRDVKLYLEQENCDIDTIRHLLFYIINESKKRAKVYEALDDKEGFENFVGQIAPIVKVYAKYLA